MTVGPLCLYLVDDLLHAIGEGTCSGILLMKLREEALSCHQQLFSVQPCVVGTDGADPGQFLLRQVRGRQRPTG
jgi:hypothetical protein